MTLSAVLDDGTNQQTQLLEWVYDLRGSLFLKMDAEYDGQMSYTSMDHLVHGEGTAQVTLTRTEAFGFKIQDSGAWGEAGLKAVQVYLYRNGQELRHFDADLDLFPEENGKSDIAEFGNVTYYIPISISREESVICRDEDAVELVAQVKDDRGNTYRSLISKLGSGTGTGLEWGKTVLKAGD